VTSTVLTADRPELGSRPRAGAALFALAIGGFAIGTTEFATMGLLPQIAAGVGVDIPTAGLLISAYALGVVIGAPVIAAFAARLPRKQLLMVLMAVFAVGNLASALAATFDSLMLSRFLAGLPHGAYFGWLPSSLPLWCPRTVAPEPSRW
jgi:MFS transporter, DHA1 family, inner membrane transport protein